MAGSQSSQPVKKLGGSTDENGKRKLKWISTGLPVKGNKRVAERLLKDTIQEYEGKHVAFSKKVLFADFLLEWMEIKKLRLKASTVENYRLTMNSSIIPYFRELGIMLQDVHPTHIQNYYGMKLDKGLSAHTILKHHSYINGALKYALSLNLIPYNPASRVTLPAKTRYQAKFLKAEEIIKLLELVENEPIKPVIVLTVFYGLRRSEVLGLRWQVVDFQQGTLLVSHTAVDGSQVSIMRTRLRIVPATAHCPFWRTSGTCWWTYSVGKRRRSVYVAIAMTTTTISANGRTVRLLSPTGYPTASRRF